MMYSGSGGASPSSEVHGMEGEAPPEPSKAKEQIAMNDFKQRKHPAHLPFVERHNEPIIVFVTLCESARRPQFANEVTHSAFLNAAREADAWSIGEYMLMPDHLHLFCRPATQPRMPLKNWVTFLKSQISGNSPGRKWQWQTDYWDTQMRTPQHYHETWEYIRLNPVRKDLVQVSEDWPWQGVLTELRW